MKYLILLLCLTEFSLAAPAPPIQRNPFTTTEPPNTITNVSPMLFDNVALTLEWSGPGTNYWGATQIINQFDGLISTANRVNGLINVRAIPFSATGDGDTDDSAAITNAIAYAGAQGTGVWFPAGEYKITQALRPEYDDFVMMFQSGAKLVVDANVNAILVSKGSGPDEVKRVRIIGAVIETFDNGVNDSGLLQLNNATDFLVQDCSIIGDSAALTAAGLRVDGMAFSQGSSGTILNSMVYGVSKVGFYAATFSHDITFISCRAYNMSGPLASMPGFSTGGATRVTYTDCKSTGNSGPGLVISATGAPYHLPSTYVTVIGGDYHNNTDQGILVGTPTTNAPYALRFDSVNCISNGASGLEIGAGRGVLIAGGSYSRNNIAGLSLQNNVNLTRDIIVDNAMIDGNAQGTTFAGVYVAGVTNLTFLGGFNGDMQDVPTQDYGFYLTTNVTGGQVSGLTILNPDIRGLVDVVKYDSDDTAAVSGFLNYNVGADPTGSVRAPKGSILRNQTTGFIYYKAFGNLAAGWVRMDALQQDIAGFTTGTIAGLLRHMVDGVAQIVEYWDQGNSRLTFTDGSGKYPMFISPATESVGIGNFLNTAYNLTVGTNGIRNNGPLNTTGITTYGDYTSVPNGVSHRGINAATNAQIPMIEVNASDQVEIASGGATATFGGPVLLNGKSYAGWPVAMPISASDETTAITTGTKRTFRMPHSMVLTGVRASLTTAQASGSIVAVDLREGGVSVLSSLVTIDNTETTSTTAATQPVISDNSLADDAEMTIVVTQVDGGTAAAGLKFYMIGYQQ